MRDERGVLAEPGGVQLLERNGHCGVELGSASSRGEGTRAGGLLRRRVGYERRHAQWWANCLWLQPCLVPPVWKLLMSAAASSPPGSPSGPTLWADSWRPHRGPMHADLRASIQRVLRHIEILQHRTPRRESLPGC